RSTCMIRRISLLVAACALLLLALTAVGGARRHHSRPLSVPTGPGPVVLPAPAVRATNTLPLHLLGRLGAEGNVFFSPHRTEAARQAINRWIAAHTGQLIKNLMSPSAITPRTALVLANAIHLKARWANPFEKSSTTPGTFTTDAGDRVQTPFMSQSETSYGY